MDLKPFMTVFSTVFVAELGDMTQPNRWCRATSAQSSCHGSPEPVSSASGRSRGPRDE